MRRLSPNFLVAYSFIVTLAFILTVYFGFIRPVHGASRTADFDRIRAHRIDLVEPDGTERLILSNRTDYPGSFFHGREIARPDRSDSAGLLFINDEGTEDGGLIYGGRSVNGKPTSHGHLSFDQYDQDQTLVLDTGLEDGKKFSQISLGDQPDYPLTPAVFDFFEHIKAMQPGPAKQQAWADAAKKYPFGPERAILRKSSDNTAELVLNDPSGHPRLKMTVAADGNPSIQFLDAAGKITRILATNEDLPANHKQQ
jgi:hypothetical protein